MVYLPPHWPGGAVGLHFTPMLAAPGPAAPQPASRPQAAPKLAELAQNALLQRFRLACVVINRNSEVRARFKAR